MLERLAWAEINLSNYAYNIRSIKKIIGRKVKFLAVLKANAYGHGLEKMGREAEKLKADYIGVVCLYEARVLREAGIKSPILILNYTDEDSLRTALDLDITLNVMDEAILSKLDHLAKKKRKRVKIHVKIDSGMHRLGLLPDQALRFIPKIENYKNIFLEGIFTHFASSDEKDLSFTHEQLSMFKRCIGELRRKNIAPPLIHAANSAATLRVCSSHFSMVRPGIITYGLPPSGDFILPFSPKPVLSLKTVIVQVRRIGKGETVGYGRTFKAKKETLVASLPIGYADGFRRAPANWGFVLIKGKRAPLLGRVSMDQSSVDITNIPDAKTGEEAILIGREGKECISAQDVAERLGTINYEVVSSLASRLSRIYIS